MYSSSIRIDTSGCDNFKWEFKVKESAQDYYPFGMLMPNRNGAVNASGTFVLNGGEPYRFGFNGKENDNEVKGAGDQQDYGMRIYDPRLGRFLSVDPLTAKYPWNSTYAFAENDVIRSIDLDGAEKLYTNNGTLIYDLGKNTDIRIVDDKYVYKVKNVINYFKKLSPELQNKILAQRNGQINAAINNLSYKIVPYKTKDELAIAWAQANNRKSINDEKEYVSNFYEQTLDGVKYQVATRAVPGKYTTADPDDTPVPPGKTRTGIIHSHGNYDPKYDNDNFSGDGGDIDYFEDKAVDGYVSTPEGTLKKYDVNTNKTNTISNKIPSDKKHPKRKNNLN